MTDEHVQNSILRPRDAKGHTLFERIEEEESFQTVMFNSEDEAEQSMLRDFREFVLDHRTLQYHGLDGSGFEVVGLAVADHAGMVILINTQGMS